MRKKTNKGQLSTWGIPGKARALSPLSLPRQGEGAVTRTREDGLWRGMPAWSCGPWQRVGAGAGKELREYIPWPHSFPVLSVLLCLSLAESNQKPESKGACWGRPEWTAWRGKRERGGGGPQQRGKGQRTHLEGKWKTSSASPMYDGTQNKEMKGGEKRKKWTRQRAKENNFLKSTIMSMEKQ